MKKVILSLLFSTIFSTVAHAHSATPQPSVPQETITFDYADCVDEAKAKGKRCMADLDAKLGRKATDIEAAPCWAAFTSDVGICNGMLDIGILGPQAPSLDGFFPVQG